MLPQAPWASNEGHRVTRVKSLNFNSSTALTSNVRATIVDRNQVRIAKVMRLYAIATHDVCVEDHDHWYGRAAWRLRVTRSAAGGQPDRRATAARSIALAGPPPGALPPGSARRY